MHFARIEMSIKPNAHVFISGVNRKDLDENIEKHLEEVYIGSGHDPDILSRNDDMPKLDFLELSLGADIFYFQSPGTASTQVNKSGTTLRTNLLDHQRSELIPATIRSDVVTQDALDRVHKLMSDEEFARDYFESELTGEDMLSVPEAFNALKIAWRNALLFRAVVQVFEEGLINAADENQALEDLGHNQPFNPYGAGYNMFTYLMETYTPTDNPRGNLGSYAPGLIQHIEEKLNDNLTLEHANWTSADAYRKMRVGLFTIWAELESMHINKKLPHESSLLTQARTAIMFAIMMDTLTAGYS